MSELKRKCVCPTCKVPVQVKGLHKNLTFSTLVACTSKLKDLLESRLAQEHAKALLQSTQVSEMDETQLPEDYSRPVSPAKNVLDALASIADVSDTDLEPPVTPQIAKESLPVQESLESIDPMHSAPMEEEPKTKRLARRSAKTTPKTTPVAKEASRMKQPASAPVLKPKGIIASKEPTTAKESLKILMSGLKPDDKALVMDYCKDLDKSVKVQIASDYDAKTVNRIIMNVDDNGLCTRTTKYLRGILDGKTIVTITWFLDSLAQKRWLAPSDYLVKGDTSIGKETGAVSRSLKSTTKLFDGYTFYLCGRFGTPSKQDLTALLKTGGAKVQTTRPKSQDDLPDNHLLIYDPDQLDDASLWIVSFAQRTSGLWVLDCISSYEILPTY